MAATVDTESTGSNRLPDLTSMSWTEVLEGLYSSLEDAEKEDEDDDYVYEYGPAERMAQHLLSMEDVPEQVRQTVERTYLQCLLWMERWADVVKHCSGGGDGDGTSAELAYAYYRLGRYGSAKSVCLEYLQGSDTRIVDMKTEEWKKWWKQYAAKTKSSEGDSVYLHILAQSCYRQSNVEEARSIYEYLMENKTNEEEEVATNLEASWTANHALLPVVASEETTSTSTTSNTDRRVNEILRRLANNYPSLSTSLLQECQSQLLELQKEEETTSEEVEAALGWCDALLQGGTSTLVLDEWLARGNACPSTIRLPGLLNKAAPAVADASADPTALEMALLSLRMYFHEVGLLTGSSVSSAKPIVALHLRVALYNRVVLLWHLCLQKSATYNSEDLRIALADLQKLLWGSVTVSTTASTVSKTKKSETEGSGKKGTAPKKSKKWTLQHGKIPHLPLSSKVEVRFWTNACGKFEGQVNVLEQDVAQARKLLQTLLKDTKKEAAKDEKERWDFVCADMQLYLSCWEQEYLEEDQKPTRPPLRSLLPSSLHSSPGVVATVAKSLTGTDLDDLLEQSQVSSGAFADWQRRLGRHDEAVQSWESVLASEPTEEDRVAALAGLIKALSFVDPDAAMERAASLPSLSSHSNAKTLTAEELEQMPIPLSTTAASTGGGKKKKARGGGATRADDSKAQQKREAVLRKRAKRRLAYLKKLESEGRYDFQRPTPPDPERWLPKQERASYKQRYRGNAKGSQGAGAGGVDAARLDVAARMAARESGGGVDSSMGPSTAHMEVAGAGTSHRRGGRRR